MGWREGGKGAVAPVVASTFVIGSALGLSMPSSFGIE